MKKIKNKFFEWLRLHLKLLKWLSTIIYILAAITLICWLFKLTCKFSICDIDWEALFTIFTTISASIGLVYKWLLSEAQYSPATALAHGYVNNFLEPLITQLKEDGEAKPVITIYVPEDIMDLFPTNIDRVKADIRNKNYQLGEINLNIKHGRARDILVVEKSKTKKLYFDFPNTLTSLISYIDYSIVSKANRANDEQKEELTKELIDKFFSTVKELIIKKRLQSHVNYCDHSLNFNF
jgi:hypothetical protein